MSPRGGAGLVATVASSARPSDLLSMVAVRSMVKVLAPVRSRVMAFDSPCRGAREVLFLDMERLRCVAGLPERSARARSRAGGTFDGVPAGLGGDRSERDHREVRARLV